MRLEIKTDPTLFATNQSKFLSSFLQHQLKWILCRFRFLFFLPLGLVCLDDLVLFCQFWLLVQDIDTTTRRKREIEMCLFPEIMSEKCVLLDACPEKKGDGPNVQTIFKLSCCAVTIFFLQETNVQFLVEHHLSVELLMLLGLQDRVDEFLRLNHSTSLAVPSQVLPNFWRRQNYLQTIKISLGVFIHENDPPMHKTLFFFLSAWIERDSPNQVKIKHTHTQSLPCQCFVHQLWHRHGCTQGLRCKFQRVARCQLEKQFKTGVLPPLQKGKINQSHNRIVGVQKCFFWLWILVCWTTHEWYSSTDLELVLLAVLQVLLFLFWLVLIVILQVTKLLRSVFVRLFP